MRPVLRAPRLPALTSGSASLLSRGDVLRPQDCRSRYPRPHPKLLQMQCLSFGARSRLRLASKLLDTRPVSPLSKSVQNSGLGNPEQWILGYALMMFLLLSTDRCRALCRSCDFQYLALVRSSTDWPVAAPTGMCLARDGAALDS